MKAQGGRRLNRRSGPTPAQRKLMQKELEGRRSGGLEEARKAQAALECTGTRTFTGAR